MLRHRIAGLAAIALALAAGAALAGPGRPSSARSTLAPPETDPPLASAFGSLHIKHFPAVGARVDRSWTRLRAHRLGKKTPYTMWMDDPTVDGELFVQWGDAFTTRGNGNVNLRLDTKHGGTTPFDLSLDRLGGASFQVRDELGSAVFLEGQFPTLPAVQ